MLPPSGAQLQASHQLKPNSLRFVLGKPFLEEGKGMDDRSPEVRFALDSPLEEAVQSELVSEVRRIFDTGVEQLRSATEPVPVFPPGWLQIAPHTQTVSR
jgi:hypothetical protein